MKAKTEFGIVRDGEHIARGFSTREAAINEIEVQKNYDTYLEEKGWFVNDPPYRYWVEEIKTKHW